jgi:hypothetical protein
MAELDRTEYKFPDEQPAAPVSADAEVPIEIEVVDDTPEADKGRKPLTESVPEPTDEELAKYDEGVQKRIKKLSHGYHDERRAKEAALREREEAFRYAQHILAENAKLKDSLGGHTKLLVDTAKQNALFALDEAKRKYKIAYDAGDADQVIEAQEALTQAKIRLDKVENFQIPATAPAPAVPTPPPRPQEVEPDPKAVAWREQNPWFGRDEEMTSFALGLHEKLVKEGVDTQSPRYYNTIDSRLREKFPENFYAPKRQSSVVAPASRSVAPKKVTLTQTQVALAKKFKIPLELYARKVLEAQND